ncbi:MAG: 5'-nucleotidase C-terminal domain-containing protein, partial [Coprobacillaceae bacterium]
SSSIFLDEEVYPMVAGLNALEYDTWTAGNHEFNYGIDDLQKAINSFKGQFLLSNVYHGEALPENRLPKTKNYTVIEKAGVRTAVIGAVTPNITRWDKDNLEGYTVTNPLDEVRSAVETIRSNNEADIVVVSFHASLGGEYEGLTDSATTIAQEVEGIDAIVCGHEHSLINTEVNGVVIVEPSSFGQYVSNVNFEVKEKEDGTGYEVVDVTAQNIKTADYQADQDILDLLKPYHDKAVEDSKTVIGELVDGPLVPEADIKGIPQVQVSDTALVDLILKVQMDKVNESVAIPEGVRHVASTALFIEDSNVQPGDFRKSDVANIYKYDNTLMTVKTTGSVLMEYLEWSASYYNTFTEGDLTVSFNPAIRMYNYDMLGGIDYKIDVSKEAGARIEGLVYSDDKAAVQADDVVYLTVNNYRANGVLSDIIGDNMEIIYDSNNDSVSTIREMIIEYISEVGTISPTVDNNWEIIGTNWNENQRDVVKQLMASGDLTTTYTGDKRTPNIESIRWEDVESVTTVVSLGSVNDIHGAVAGTSSNPGVAKFATAVKSFKTSNEHAYFLGSGDLYQGSAISNLTQGKVMNEVFKELGMTYSAVGNHEFDWGEDKLDTFMEDGAFQFLAANVTYLDGTSPSWAQPTAMIEVGGIKVGIIGITTPNTKYQTAAENVADLEFLDPIATTIKYEEELRNQGADSVIVLSHLGSAPEGATGYDLEAEELAEAVPTIDGIFSAHYHLTVDKEVNGVPILQGSYNGRALSKLTLVFDNDGNLISNFGDVENLRAQIPDLADDETVNQIVAKYTEDLEPILGEKVAETPINYPHDTNISPVTDMGQLTAMMMTEIGNTEIAIINGGGIRNGFTAGDITMGTMYEIFPFDNTLVTMELTGEDLKAVIEHGIPPCDFKAGQFYGINVYYDFDDDGNPVVSKMFLLDGTEIKMDETYTVSTLDFLLTGGDKYDFSNAINAVDTMIPLRDTLVEWMKDKEVLDFVPQKNLFQEEAPVTPTTPLEITFNDVVNMVVDANTTEQDFIDALDISSNYPITITTDFLTQVDLTKDGSYNINITFTKVSTSRATVQGTDSISDVVKLTIQSKDGSSIKPGDNSSTGATSSSSTTISGSTTQTGDNTNTFVIY